MEERIIKNYIELSILSEELKNEGKKIVLTNGCFDILHRGHVEQLNKGKELGDILIVGVNIDETIKRSKGPERPINKLEDRLFMLANLKSVDYVVAFSEANACNLISIVKPYVYFKGSDYNQEIPEYKVAQEVGSKVVFIDLKEGYSTTNIVNKIRLQQKTKVVS